MSSMFVRIILIIPITLFVIASCGDDIKKKPIEQKDPEIEVITPDFKGEKFSNPAHLELLKELNICDVIDSDSTSYYAACSPKNFELLTFNEKKDVTEAFILQTRSAIRLKGQDASLPVRHILIFERENGSLVRINGFRGELIAMEDGKNGMKELMVAIYLKEDDTVFNCLFKWKDNKYSFDSVVALDWGEGMKPLKANKKEEVSAEIYTSLMAANLIF